MIDGLVEIVEQHVVVLVEERLEARLSVHHRSHQFG